MLGFPVLDLEGMRRMMLEVSGFRLEDFAEYSLKSTGLATI